MDKTSAQGELLFNRLSKRYRHLKKWARRTGTNAFRLYDRDIPEIPLVLDLYDNAVSGALYKRPYEKDDEETWLLAMRSAAGQALGIPEDLIFIKERHRMRRRQEEGTQYGRMSNLSFYRDVAEEDLSFRVNLTDYLDTGLFLDARKKRALIRSEAAGKRVLNLFAYTCSLSVAAAKGGAVQVDSVDLSKNYLDWGRLNFTLNGLEAFHSGDFPQAKGMTLIQSDVLQFIRRAAQKALRWDLIILDPPSFSNSKKMNGFLDIRRDHGDIIDHCLSLLGPGGRLIFSSNARGIKLDAGDFPGFTVKDIGKDLVDEDFKNRKLPACYILEKPIPNR